MECKQAKSLIDNSLAKNDAKMLVARFTDTATSLPPNYQKLPSSL